MHTTICYDLIKADEQLLKRRRKLTIIVAMKESDESLLIGADTMNTEDDNLKATSGTKLFKHSGQNIVWGTSGNREISRHEFSPWLQSLTIGGDWEWLKFAIADKIAELNGRQRERETKAGVTHNPGFVIGCLLVGWLNGEPQIYEFTDDARIDSYYKDEFRAIGSAVTIAYGAYWAMRLTKGITQENQFKIILETTCQKALYCSKPFHIKRVKQDGIEDVT